MQSGDELLIGITEASQLLGVNKATVARWAISGKLPPIRKLPGRNGAYLFDAGMVRRLATERLIERQRRAS